MNTHQMFNLRRLSELLRNLPPEKFDMKHWSYGSACGDIHECGTKACIAGWSTVVFDDLKLEVTPGCSHTALVHTDTRGLHYDEYEAIVASWGISYTEAQNLCSSNLLYNSPTDAADGLDELIEKYFIEKGDTGYVNGVN